MMLSVEISTESIYCSEYLSQSVMISLSECDARSVRIPSVYAEMQSSTAVLRKDDDVACMSHHPDGVAYATSPSNEVRRVV
jgi:hypothetical protein